MPCPVGRFSTLLLAAAAFPLSAAPPPAELPLAALEQRLLEIDGQLAHLANYNLGGGVGSIGSRSRAHETAERLEWMEIDLGGTVPLDEIVLVPAIRRDGLIGFQADGFPQVFRIRAGTGADRTGRVVAEFSAHDGLLPRIAPLVIPVHGLPASWIRIEATMLSQREFDARFVLQFAEILAFSGEENVALHRPVAYPSDHERSSAPGWRDSAVVDGFLPYLMVAATGPKSVAYLSSGELGDQPTLTIDLGTSHPISRLHLHAVDQSDTVPQAFAGDIGIPRLLRLEGANQPDFSDGRVLLTLQCDTLYDVGPILMRTFPVAACRYVRLVAVQLANDPLYGSGSPRLGFAEIELFALGRNVALNQPVTASFRTEDRLRPLSSLTDGRNFYGTILPLRTWLNQLALRHELERERPRVSAELNRRFVQQKAKVTRLAGLAAGLAFTVVVIVIVDRIRQRRAIERTRKRIAADLHDELGADLHALGLLSDLARGAQAEPDRLGDLLERIRTLTERTGQAARHCTNLLEAGDLHGDLTADLRHASTRILADLDHRLEIEGEAQLRRLRPRKRVDLLLFYQECLINVIRHSGATRVHSRLAADEDQVALMVSDNGRGLKGGVPASLRRRARLLGAEVEVGAVEPQGARVVLLLRRRWLGILP